MIVMTLMLLNQFTQVHECGVVLGSFLLISSSWLACSSWLAYSSSVMLIEAATSAKCKTYFGLAQASYGTAGKLVVEISMIGLLLGTCIAVFASLEDLVAILFLRLTGSSVTPWQLFLLLVTITTVSVLPLSLQKKVFNSAWQSLISIIFYIFLTIVLVVNCLISGLSGGLILEKVHLWHWSGIPTCLPILATSFCSHPLALTIYFNFHGQTVDEVNAAYKQASITVVIFYIMVGLSGYLSYDESVPGNILAALSPSLVTDGIRAIFLMSLTSSFPLVILPCCQAINTLLFEDKEEDGIFSVSGEMTFHRHVIITVLIIYCTMLMGVLVPNVQTVLAVMGTTMGSIICFICPSVIYAKLHKDTFKGRIILGVGIMFLFIRTSSMSDFTTSELSLQPVRKSIVAEGTRGIKLTNMTEASPESYIQRVGIL
ncbi:putative sodium-coupled neutral amino acid transporter 10 [Mobula hypostoma]|uniref:putative sodium-coupled neutral amino acid transporter 10 n=1 Tax=Mobula hypostoma TaxID=723540 RepID=UPI002FC3A389